MKEKLKLKQVQKLFNEALNKIIDNIKIKKRSK